ncbi:MAG: hypothetical protein GX430_12470 [Treponema sp.]|nr:hypothetical protein [Treponema sp.]
MSYFVAPPRRQGHPAAALLAAWVLWILPGGGLTAQEPRAGKPRLSVLYFSDTRGAPDLAWLSKGLADLLAGDLGATGAFTLVEREELERVLREQELVLSGLVDPAGAPKVGRLLGADLLLYGSFLGAGEELRIDARVVRAETGEIAASARAEGPTARVLDLERELSARLAAALGIPAAPGPSVRTPPGPSSLDAARAYYRGLDLMDAGRYAEALEYFSQSTRLDPLYLKPGKGIEDAYRYLKDFRKQRQRREMNALVEDITALSARIRAPTFFSFGDAVMNPGRFGFRDAAEVTEAYRAHPYRMAGDTPVQAVWNLQNLLHQLGRSASENFGDEALADRCRDEVLRWSDAAEAAYPRDPFLPEVLYQKIFVHADRMDWTSLRVLCERLMSDYPDYRMMWAVEDFYERALKELGG